MIGGEFVEVAVVHEEPALVAEGVAVGLLHGAADRGAYVGEEVWRADVVGQLVQVVVVPGRFGAVEDARIGLSPYHPTPKPSPFVVSAPSVECRLWSINEWAGV